jgi:hypothetical protein
VNQFMMSKLQETQDQMTATNFRIFGALDAMHKSLEAMHARVTSTTVPEPTFPMGVGGGHEHDPAHSNDHFYQDSGVKRPKYEGDSDNDTYERRRTSRCSITTPPSMVAAQRRMQALKAVQDVSWDPNRAIEIAKLEFDLERGMRKNP